MPVTGQAPERLPHEHKVRGYFLAVEEGLADLFTRFQRFLKKRRMLLPF